MENDIRKVSVGDEKSLAYIQTESWKAAYSHIVQNKYLNKYLDMGYISDIYSKLLKSGKGHGFIMRVNEIDSCIAFWDKSRKVDENKIAEIICIHCLPQNWRKGYGTKFMNFLFDDIKKYGYHEVILWVLEKNDRAKLFYEAMGFHKTALTRTETLGLELCYKKNLLD